MGDVLKPIQTSSDVLLGLDEGNHEVVALKLLHLLPRVLSSKRLKTHISKLLQRNDTDASNIRDTFSGLLEKTLKLGDEVGDVATGIIFIESILGKTNEYTSS